MLIKELSSAAINHLFSHYGIMWDAIPPNLTNAPPKTSEVIAISLIRMLIEGPLVSFIGSPTVSPTTDALCVSVPFRWTWPSMLSLPASMYFLALSQAPPEFEAEIAI